MSIWPEPYILQILGEKMFDIPFYENLEFSYPHVTERMVDAYQDDQYGWILVLEDGTKLLYDFISLRVRALPSDPANMSEEEYAEQFSFRLRRMMTVRGITQCDLADMIGKSQGIISRYTRGESLPMTYTLYQIARALDCSVDDLIYTDKRIGR